MSGYQYPPPGQTPVYAPQYQPAPTGSPTYEKSAFEGGRFKPKKKINDPIFLVVFILQVLKNSVSKGVDNNGYGGGLGSTGGRQGLAVSLNASTVYLLLLVAAAGVLLSVVQLILTRLFPRVIMHIALSSLYSPKHVIITFGICVYYWLTKYYSGAIIFTVLALLSILSYFGFRRRIPLAALLLSVVMDISKHHKSVFSALAVFYAFAAIATYSRWTPNSPACATDGGCSSRKVASLIFFLTFSFLWTSQVIGNVALATLAGGPYGTWYYFGPREMGQMPKHPTLSAFARASTLSLGSIAFGSLIVTILETIKIILQAIQHNASADGHPVEAILACCAACCVGCIEGLIEWFNRYAYIEIALYGKPYIPAAKDTWRLLVDRGIDALVNDSLVGMTLAWGGYAVGMLGSLFAYLYLRFTDPPYNSEGQYTAAILLYAFLIALQCSLTMSSAIEAGVSTIFVGLGEDPQVLAVRAPELFALIQSTYPQVRNWSSSCLIGNAHCRLFN
ncbi:plasma-membrane choline transporter-domain-containing protein [Flagelloscypha sp. PMI_526]|nr:plasma-membrane choline transporter-domain-containing protein [Flagelloscypha sp. PMI_526]